MEMQNKKLQSSINNLTIENKQLKYGIRQQTKQCKNYNTARMRHVMQNRSMKG